MQNETKNCQNCKSDFVIDTDDFSFYKKMDVPPPTFCPECRAIRRLARRNERTLHRRMCEKCDKSIISVFAEDSGIHVYCSPCWWSDTWDGMEYEVDFDPSQNVLTQLDALYHRVPIMNLYGLYTTLVNSDYTNMVGWLKNCYMMTYCDYGENLIYGSFVNHSKDSVDNLMGNKIELSYETINCNQCYSTFFSVDCTSCNNVLFSKNCVGCNNCFGCVNLKQKSYHIFNEPYSKEEYEEKMKELYPSSQHKIESAQEKAEALWKQFPQKYMHGIRTVNSTGDYITDTKNARDCFIGFNIEDSRFCSFVTGKMTDAYDHNSFGESSSLLYETLQSGDQNVNIRMSHWVITNCQNVEYSMFCINSKDLFCCVGLKKKQYCIFNKQYTKEEYFKLRGEIIAHMNENPYIDNLGLVYKYGEFFPIETCPFGYNETTAQEFFPLTKEQALAKGYPWREQEKRNYKITIDANDLPEEIGSVSDAIVSEIIGCEHGGTCNDSCTEAFKIVGEELSFYRRMNLPLPHLCPNCRHAKRLQFRNPMKLWHRKCMHEGCENEFETSYAPERPEIIYCESCYQSEVS
ncbi:MAG: hypothetical protein KBC17_01425 [Candidatus Pacebacteria bacterium]|nr:hypothetical protein [Candidatus Paceibacterota bacterium]